MWTGGGGGTTRKLNTFLMSEDRWQRALKEHNHRVKAVKPAVDLKSPWGCSRPYVPLPPPSNPHHAAAGAAAAAGGVDTSRSSARNRPSSASRPTSASTTGRRPGSAASTAAAGGAVGGRPTSATSRASSSAATGGRPQSGAQVISQLPLPQQRLCEDVTKMLCGLDKDASKLVLEHLYAAAEEGRLLRSYSGVYPGLLVSNASGADDDKAFEEATE